MKTRILILALIAFAPCVIAQKIEVLSETPGLSLRGLSVVSDDVVWASGNKGTVGKSTDGGKTWWWTVVKGFETSDFRDIEAFNDKVAVIISIAEPAFILRTTDGGESWKVTYENRTKGMFMDAMDFSDDLHGTVVGDVVAGKLFVTHTSDGGVTWTDEPASIAPVADSIEGFFSSSGTNVRQLGKNDYISVSEGRRSRVYYKKEFHEIPFGKGTGSSGANSVAVRKTKAGDKWVVVGGDFRFDSLRINNCYVSVDHGKSWITPTKSPLGYRSCVEFISDTDLITCGLNGVDYSTDGGMNWSTISKTGFHACRKAKMGKAVFLSGGKGRIGKLVH